MVPVISGETHGMETGENVTALNYSAHAIEDMKVIVQRGVSQTLLEAAITQPRPVFSCFVNLLQSEEARKQIILVIDGPAA